NDEAYNSVPSDQPPAIYKLNIVDPDNVARGNSVDDNFIYYWNRAFTYLRKINIFLEKMAAPESPAFADKKRLIAEAKFVRAVVYFNLIERFGGVPIVTQSYILTDVGSVNFKRSSFDECVAFIQKDVTEAMPDLPAKYASNAANYGRGTQDAAYAL